MPAVIATGSSRVALPSSGCNFVGLQTGVLNYAGERLIACRNSLLAEEPSRKRQEVLAATEKRLDQIVAATRRNNRPARQEKDWHRHRQISGTIQNEQNTFSSPLVSETSFAYERNLASIAEEAALDGI